MTPAFDVFLMWFCSITTALPFVAIICLIVWNAGQQIARGVYRRRARQIVTPAIPSVHTNHLDKIMAATLDKFRMLVWLLVGLGLYSLSIYIGTGHPSIQTIAYKLGHVTTLAWVGYWIARMSLGRITNDTRHSWTQKAKHSEPNDRLARAVIIAGVIIAGSLGL